jgi:hypothetical protein
MAIGNLSLFWFDKLQEQDVFKGKRSMLDLGRSDADIHYRILNANLEKAVDKKAYPRLTRAEAIERNQEIFQTFAPLVFKSLGINEYKSSDLFDEKADFSIDLNAPENLGLQFDIVSDFGTIEHIANPSTALRFVHDCTKVDGLMIHCVPVRGGCIHGFFNIHATFLDDVARANGYDIVSNSYIPNVVFQHRLLSLIHVFGLDPAKWIRIYDPSYGCSQKREYWYSVETLLTPLLSLLLFRNVTVARDHLYYCFRKTRDQDYVDPMQGVFVPPE